MQETWVGKISWRREQLPTPVFWPEEFYGLYRTCLRTQWIYNGKVTQGVGWGGSPLKDEVIPSVFLGTGGSSDGKGPRQIVAIKRLRYFYSSSPNSESPHKGKAASES